MGSGQEWEARESERRRHENEVAKGKMIQTAITNMNPHELFTILDKGEDILFDVLKREPITRSTRDSLESLRLNLVRLFNGCPESTLPEEYRGSES